MSEEIINEDGVWSAEEWPNEKIVLQSSDFTHDVVLEISGDFTSKEQKIGYASEIARRLNRYKGNQ